MRSFGVGCAALAVAFAQGCGSPQLYEGFDQDLNNLRACGDLTVYAVDARDTVALVVTLDAPLAASDDAGGATTDAYLPDNAAAVEVRVRRKASAGICDDVQGPSYQQIWTAVEGFVHAEVSRDDAGDVADVQVEDLVLMWEADREPMTVDAFEWSGLAVEAPPG